MKHSFRPHVSGRHSACQAIQCVPIYLIERCALFRENTMRGVSGKSSQLTKTGYGTKTINYQVIWRTHLRIGVSTIHVVAILSS